MLNGVVKANINFITSEPTFLIQGKSFKLSMLQHTNGEWSDLMYKFTDLTAINDRWLNLTPELLGFNYSRARDACRDMDGVNAHYARGNGKMGTTSDVMSAVTTLTTVNAPAQSFRPVLKVNH